MTDTFEPVIIGFTCNWWQLPGCRSSWNRAPLNILPTYASSG